VTPAARARGSSWPFQLTGVLTVGLVAATFVQSALAGLGLLLTTVGLSGAAAAPYMGRACDRLGGRAVLSWVFLISGATVLLLAVAPNVAWMVGAGAFAGLALGAGNPATNKLSADHVTGGHQGAVMGVKQSGPPLGVLFAGLVLPSVAAALGWRWALALIAVVPFAGLVWMLRVIPPEPRSHRAPIRTAALPASARSTMWWLTGIGTLVATGVAGALAFLPLYAQQSVGFSTLAAGLMASMVGLTGIVGRIVWSWQGVRFRHLSTPLAIIGVLSVAGAGLIWAAADVGAPVLWVGAFISGISMMAWHAVAWLALVTEVEPGAVGAASGVVHLGSSIGFGVGPLIFGLIADHFSYGAAWGTTSVLFAISAVATLVWRAQVRGTRGAPAPGAPGDTPAGARRRDLRI
jgi:predicted MFS family arabinose efflux permease